MTLAARKEKGNAAEKVEKDLAFSASTGVRLCPPSLLPVNFPVRPELLLLKSDARESDPRIDDASTISAWRNRAAEDGAADDLALPKTPALVRRARATPTRIAIGFEGRPMMMIK